MKYQISPYMPFRPQVTPANPEFLSIMGEDGIRTMISDFYDLLIVSDIKDMFPQDNEGFAKAKEHSADFFIQFLGGPSYFNQKRGRPMMVARHNSFCITPEARIVWLGCFKQVLQPIEMRDNIKQSFWDYLDIFSIWMVNTKSEENSE